MIDPRNVTPLLDHMVIDHEAGKGPNGIVYHAVKTTDNKQYAVKHISIPASESKTKALIYSGAVRNEREAQRYYNGLVKDLKNELLLINNIRNAPNLHKYRGYQVDQKLLGSGYDIYLLTEYGQSLVKFLQTPISKVNAVNLGIDLAAALEQLRSGDLIHKDVKPTNIFYEEDARFTLGDLGVAQLSELSYSTMPDAMITAYTAPEVMASDASLSSTMDIYSVGVILYQIYNGGTFPVDAAGHFVNSEDISPAAPAYADERMTEIILKACAFKPEDRYQDPAEMKKELVLYAQSSDVSSDFLVPQPEPEPEPEPVAGPDEKLPAESAEKTVSSEAEAAAVPEGNAGVTDNTMVYEIPVTDNTITIPDFSTKIIQAVSGSQTAAASDSKASDTVKLSRISGTEPELLTGATKKQHSAGRGALNSLGKDDMILAPDGEESVADFLARHSQKNGVQLYSMDGTGNMTAIPNFIQGTPSDENMIESADSEDAPAHKESEAAASRQTPKQGDIPAGIHLPPEVLQDDMPDIVDSVRQKSAATADHGSAADLSSSINIDEVVHAVAAQINNTQATETITVNDPVLMQSLTQQSAPKRRAPEPVPAPQASAYPSKTYEEENNYDEDEEEAEDEDEDEEKHGGGWKTVLIAIIVLLVLGGGAYAFYTFKTDTVTEISTEVLSSTSIEVMTSTEHNSAMEVICSTASGEVSRADVDTLDHTATFTDLNPNTAYSFTLSSTSGKVLLGTKTTDAKTNQMTNLNGFAVTGYSATSASFSLSGTGSQPDSWLVTLASDTGESITKEVTGTEFTIDGLTPQTTYQVSIAKGDGDILGGTTTCSFTTQEYTVLSSFAQTSLTTDSMSLAWEYTGTEPDSWTLTCTGSDGSSLTQDISGNNCTLNNLTSGVTYTLTLSCISLQETGLSTIEVSIPTITITGTSSYIDDEGHLVFCWDYEGDITPNVWTVSYTYDSSVAPETAATGTNAITLPDLLPGTSYEFTVVSADDLSVGGESVTASYTSPSAEQYTAYGCTDPTLTLYVKSDDDPDLENATTEFTTEDYIAFAIEVSYEETEEDKTASTMYIIRNADGTPVHVYESSRTWNGNWTTARHTGDLPDTITEPGSYTLEVYFDGCFMASADFNVS